MADWETLPTPSLGSCNAERCYEFRQWQAQVQAQFPESLVEDMSYGKAKSCADRTDCLFKLFESQTSIEEVNNA